MINGKINTTLNNEKLLKLKEIFELKQFLASTDYKALKFAEGEYTEEEYAPVRLQRQQARQKIKELESKEIK